jgi:hypothetical protein
MFLNAFCRKSVEQNVIEDCSFVETWSVSVTITAMVTAANFQSLHMLRYVHSSDARFSSVTL